MTSEDCFCNLRIVNLSSKELRKGQIKLLSKGLKFTPTPKKDMCEISPDIQNFCTKLRKKEFFEDKSDASHTDESLAKNKSNFFPPRNRNITLDNNIYFLTKFPLEELQVKDIKRSNLTKEQHTALQELRGDSEIIIFEADKGGAFAVMDRTYYADKILEMLNDSGTQEIFANKDKNVMKVIKELAGNHSHNLTEKEVNYLCHFDFKTSGFYGLPKIHKSEIICQEAKVQTKPYIRVLRPADLKFRPIVAGPRCPTSRLRHPYKAVYFTSPKLSEGHYRFPQLFTKDSTGKYNIVHKQPRTRRKGHGILDNQISSRRVAWSFFQPRTSTYII